eukprot:CAMPEP_0197002050 /NCGR_PEP_ID=MMETSP1380-20130617/6611_1 /TAXON_ID=5936 /ORGANISM="Euplotes crassus, Strain CT5" /LENGTH=408 /DNA_ID=CAMNT_0042419981 /DNA_START=1 /DNA_END=1225 /DNA_ORIENTATION=+
MPKSFREPAAAAKAPDGIPDTVTKTMRRRDQRGNSLMQKPKENSKNIEHPIQLQLFKNNSSSKMLFASKAHGSSSLVRPKRIIYPSTGEGELPTINHDAAKQKLETLFNKNGIKKRDPLQLLTKPKKKLNLLKKLPNNPKFNSGKSYEDKTLFLQKSDVKLNRTGMNQLKRGAGMKFEQANSERITTTQTKSTNRTRVGTKQGGRTRAQIISEFFCSQNWNYLAKKSLMVKNEREQFGNSIAKFRRVKRGIRKIQQIYRKWIAKVKAKCQHKVEEKQLLKQKEEEILLQQKQEEEKKIEEVKQKKAQPDEICEIQEVQKPEFILSEDSDIFSLNEGVDLSKFKESSGINTDEYADTIKTIKEDKKKRKEEIKGNRLDEIIEEEDESVILSPFHTKAGKVLARIIEITW